MVRALMACALLLAASPARADCEVQGVASLDRLRVRVEGEALRTFSVTELPVAIRPGRGTRYRDVRVLAPVEFGARTDARIPWTVPRPRAYAGGMLWLTPGIEIEDVREQVEREDLVMRAQVDRGVWIDRIHAPCSAIAVGIGEGSEEAPLWGEAGGPRWLPANGVLWVRSQIGAAGTATVRVDAPDGLRSPLIEIERRDGWVRVVGRFESGARLRGWVRQHHLRAAPEGDTAAPPYERAIRTPPVGQCRRRPPARDEYVGPARLTVGAMVRFEVDGETWGTISEPAIFTISWRQGATWARIVHAPGLRGDGQCPEVISHAWVQRSQVTLSGEGSASVPGSLLGIE